MAVELVAFTANGDRLMMGTNTGGHTARAEVGGGASLRASAYASDASTRISRVDSRRVESTRSVRSPSRESRIDESRLDQLRWFANAKAIDGSLR